MTGIRSTTAAKATLAIGMIATLLLAGCGKPRPAQHVHIGPDSLPTKSYERGPEEPFNRSDYVVRLKQMTSFYDVPGEAGYFMNGEDYGFDALSFILTETQPGGGPPLHTHDSEESHVVLHGRVEYVIGDRCFTVEGPYVARVPAGVPHTFRNAGTEPFNLIAVFPDKHLTYKELGKNPLVKPTK
jgi:mannose-6-phosphate isomerase-like protein (cupin superfamily)